MAHLDIREKGRGRRTKVAAGEEVILSGDDARVLRPDKLEW
jgi:hypothetical protein